MKLFDTHCHFDSLQDAREQLPRAYASGVRAINIIGCDVETTQRSIDVVKLIEDERDSLGLTEFDAKASVGLHPHDAEHFSSQQSELENILAQNRDLISGIGETGYDFYYNHSSKEDQTQAFKWQIALAKEHSLTMIIHTRDAWEQTFELLADVGWPQKSVLHCFTGGPQEALKAVENGSYISISGIATFKNAQDVRDAIAVVPLDRLLIETDAPYLAPVPHRGKTNEPGFVSLVANEVVSIRVQESSNTQAEVQEALFDNAIQLFR